MLRHSSVLILLLISTFLPGHKATTGPSDEPIAVNPANLPGGNLAVEFAPSPAFFQDFKPPFPTNAWWSGLTLGWQSNVLAGPFPFQSRTENSGLRFGVSESRRFDGTTLHQEPAMDWEASFTGMPQDANARKATYWDTQVVCLAYFNGGSKMDTCMVPGSPYMTFTFTDAAPVFTSLEGPVSNMDWVIPGSKLKVTTLGTELTTYIFYALGGGLDLQLEGNATHSTLVSPTPYSGSIRVAKLVRTSPEDLLDKHVEAVPTGVTLSYTVTGDVSEQTWTWTVEGNAADLLIMSYPHHRKVLVNPVYADIEYMSIKGMMKGIVGNIWIQRHDLPTTKWFAPRDPDPSCFPELNKTLQIEVDSLELGIPGNYYFWGGEFAKVAQLATIAEHIGRQDLIPKIVEALKIVEHYFDPTHPELLAYETGWGGVVSTLDVNSQMFNDHHFTYAYSLHGAAVIGKYDPAWLEQHKDFFLQLARNIANPSPNDPHYAVTRHMDFFHGHSWASGLGNSAGARAQESSSEAINAYYSLILFAEAIGNQHLLDYSRMLLAIELAGSIQYWHLYPTVNDPDTPYPEQAFRDLVSVGNLLDASVGAWLYWGGQRIQIAAIQLLPLTPIGNLYFDVPWMEQVLDYCMVEIEDITIGDSFKSVIVAAYATVDPQRAYLLSQEISDWGGGNSWTNSLYFISTQESQGAICPAQVSTPEGIFVIQDVDTGKYITVGSESSLAAVAAVDVLATKFSLSFKPGGGNIQSLSNGKYVSADTSGTNALAASKDTASGYELFRWYSQADDTYTLRAQSNKFFVATQPEGELVNTGSTSNYRLIPSSDAPPPPVPAGGKLRNAQTNNFVVATAEDPILHVGAGEGEATEWSFERVPESPDSSPLYAIKSGTTQNYVTADPTGTAPLAATKEAPGGWEHFQILAYNGGYIILHSITGLAVAAQPDETLIDNNLTIDPSAQWAIV